MENQNNSIPAPFMIVMNSHPAATDTQLSAKIRPTAFLALSNWKNKFSQLGIFLYTPAKTCGIATQNAQNATPRCHGQYGQ